MNVELHPGRWWSRASGEDPRFICELCPRRCHLKPGQRGFCFVRMGTEHGVDLATYARSSGACIDPIEKKPLNHFLPGTPVLSFGTAGCNLGCRFCQNWNISKARQSDRLMDRASPEGIAAAAQRTSCRSVAFTYNDPVIFAEYAIDTAQACHAVGVNTVAVTAGYVTERAREDLFGVMDAANVDLKAFTERFYKRLCYGALQPVKETLRWLVRDTDVWVEVTTLLIPGENDSDAEIHALATWFREDLGADVPLHFSAYHPDYRLDRPRTAPQTLERARTIAHEEGLRYVYTGNVHDRRGGSTWCATCGNLLIERDWYVLGSWNLDHRGRCNQCGTQVPGRFDPRPGDWGAKRLPVHIDA